MNPDRKRRSPWLYAGIGCAVVLLFAVIAVVTVGYLGYRKAKQMAAEMTDPVARTAKVKTILGCETLPPGYNAIFAISVPIVMDMALISDQIPDAQGRVKGTAKLGLMYINVLSQAEQQKDLRDFFEGRKAEADILRQQGIRIDSRQVLRRGAVEVNGQHLSYVAQRGDFEMKGSHLSGLTTLFLVDCPADQRMRLGVWFGRDPAPDQSPETVDFTGTPADESALRTLVGHFKLCPR
jgi:hypothetical protein